jgi:hypothetical protein
VAKEKVDELTQAASDFGNGSGCGHVLLMRCKGIRARCRCWQRAVERVVEERHEGREEENEDGRAKSYLSDRVYFINSNAILLNAYPTLLPFIFSCPVPFVSSSATFPIQMLLHCTFPFRL